MEKFFRHSFRLYYRQSHDALVRQANVDRRNAEMGRYGSDSSNTSLVGGSGGGSEKTSGLYHQCAVSMNL